MQSTLGAGGGPLAVPGSKACIVSAGRGAALSGVAPLLVFLPSRLCLYRFLLVTGAM